MTKPTEQELVFNTDAWTWGTNGPAKGMVVRAPADDDALEAMKGKWKNVWLLDPPRALYSKLTTAMAEGGGFGFLTKSRGDLLLTGGRPARDIESVPKIAIVQLHRDSFEAISAQLEAGVEVEVELDIHNEFRAGPIPLYNVIADLKGTEFPDEYVVVGGHLDSWDGATGTTDNGTGSATTIEAARILTAIGAKPRRTIRFMLWSGEEQGLLGSRAWVQKHKDEMGKYSACLVHDGGTNYVAGIAGMAEMHPQLDTVFAPVLDLDPEMPFRIRDIDAFRPIGSDHESFTAADVPGFFWDQKGRANYTHTHHTQYDTYDAAIPEYQRHSSVVIATGALGIANLPTMLTRENMKVSRGFGGGGGRGGAGGNQRLLGIALADDGVTIAEVNDDSVASKAGLQSGDKILAIDDQPIEGQATLRRALNAGDKKKKITFERMGAKKTVEAVFER